MSKTLVIAEKTAANHCKVPSTNLMWTRRSELAARAVELGLLP